MAAHDLKQKIGGRAPARSTGYYLTDSAGKRYPADGAFALSPFMYPIDVPEGRFRVNFVAESVLLPPDPDHPLAGVTIRFDTGDDKEPSDDGPKMIAKIQEAAESAKIRQETLKAEQKTNVEIVRDQQIAGFLALISDMRGLVKDASAELVQGRMELARELAEHNQLLMKQQTEVLHFVKENLETLRKGPPPPVDYRSVYEKGFEMVRDVTIAIVNRPSRPQTEKTAQTESKEPSPPASPPGAAAAPPSAKSADAGDVVDAKAEEKREPAPAPQMTPEQATHAMETLLDMDAVDVAQIFSSPEKLGEFFRRVGNTAKVIASEQGSTP